MKIGNFVCHHGTFIILMMICMMSGSLVNNSIESETKYRYRQCINFKQLVDVNIILSASMR